MSPPTERVLALLELLQTTPGATAAELAGLLSVNERTVRRYVTHLSGLGLPVRSRRGRNGGFHLAAGYRMPPLMLTNDEAIAVVVGLVAAARAGLPTGGGGAASAFAKICPVLPPSAAERVEGMLRDVGLGPGAAEPDGGSTGGRSAERRAALTAAAPRRRGG